MKKCDYPFASIYVIIHSLDMGQLKNSEWLYCLSELATTQRIKFIISIDHVKSGILFKDQILDKFNFYSVQINTYQDYDLENEYMPPLFSAKNDN